MNFTFISKRHCESNRKYIGLLSVPLVVLLSAITIGSTAAHELYHDGIIESEECPVYLLQETLNSDTSILHIINLFLACVFYYGIIAWSINIPIAASKAPTSSRAPPCNI